MYVFEYEYGFLVYFLGNWLWIKEFVDGMGELVVLSLKELMKYRGWVDGIFYGMSIL